MKMEDIGKIIYQFYEQTKPVFIVFWAWMLSILTPVNTVICILGVAFIANMFAGIASGVNIDNEKFDIGKLFNAFKEMIVVCLIIIFVNTMFSKLNDATAADVTTKTILYIAVYGYSTKFTGNLKKLYPSWQIVAVLHDILTTAVLAKLKDRIGITNNKTKIDEL